MNGVQLFEEKLSKTNGGKLSVKMLDFKFLKMLHDRSRGSDHQHCLVCGPDPHWVPWLPLILDQQTRRGHHHQEPGRTENSQKNWHQGRFLKHSCAIVHSTHAWCVLACGPVPLVCGDSHSGQDNKGNGYEKESHKICLCGACWRGLWTCSKRAKVRNQNVA